MKSKFHNVALIGKFVHSSATSRSPDSSGTPPEVLRAVANILQNCGCRVALEAQTAHKSGLEHEFYSLAMNQIGRSCDLAVVIGGDGTMLSAARLLAPSQIPLIGINQGRLGFITDIPLGVVHEKLPLMLAGQYTEDRRSMMLGQVISGDTCRYEALAFNDVVINRGSTAGMVELRVEVDGHFVSNMRADGLIVATATGSTAYALSAGGPLIHPSVAGWVLVPIAPHTLSNRPIVLGEAGEISIELVAGRKASANFDTQSVSMIHPGERITVRRAVHEALFLHPKGWNYFDTLREKLQWNSGSN